MRSFSRIAVAAAAFALSTLCAHADAIKDPRIVIADPACPASGCIPVGTNFSFGVPAQGFGALVFTNTSGVDWFNLKLVETGVPASAITCVTNVFASCGVSTINGVTNLFLSGLGPKFAGITSGENFLIEFGCSSGKCDHWPGDMDFTAIANVPEPGTVGLLLTGIAAIVGRRQLLKRLRAS